MLIMASFQKSLIVEQFQGNYLKVPMKQKITKAYLKDRLKKRNMVFSFFKYLITLGRY